MRRLCLVLMTALVATACAGDSQLPAEVQSFVDDREVCDHFRGEPYEGDSPEQIKRREFIIVSLEIHCPGIDRRLAALKQRYSNNDEVLKLLSIYEERTEGIIDAP